MNQNPGVVHPERLTVEELLNTHGKVLRLKILAGSQGLKRSIEAMEVNRPGLALVGHLAHFRPERIQVLGRGEQSYLKQVSEADQLAAYKRICKYSKLPCFIITRQDGPQPSPKNRSLTARFAKICEQKGIPLLCTPLETADFIGELHSYLEDRLALCTYVHGVLVDVYGLGVLIEGKSGVGKSECALELLKRGHFFVADDLVRLKRLPGEVLTGSPAKREFGAYMEVRGLGVIDVNSLFGIGSAMDKTRVELAVTLELWRPGMRRDHYERIGLASRSQKILGIEVPHVLFPVFPGRNLAALIEVASLNQRLKGRGIHSAQVFQEKLLEKTSRSA